METQTKITLIRHAESYLNIASHDFRIKNNLPYIWQILCQHQQFILGVKYNPDFLDCDITQKGIQQCIKARNHMQDIQPDLILVSPLLRTLRTCSIVFQNHKNVPVICQPILAEAFRCSCDIASLTSQKIKLFPNYNFDAVVAEGDFWFIKNDSLQNQQKYYQVLQKHQQKSHSQKMHQILNLMIKTYIYQHPQNLRERIRRIKNMIKEKYSGKYKHIAIVAHYNIVNYLMAEQFDQKSEPKNCLKVDNCQIVQNYLEKMLTHN